MCWVTVIMNRRIRFRTYGGVRGRELEGSLLLDLRSFNPEGFDAVKIINRDLIDYNISFENLSPAAQCLQEASGKKERRVAMWRGIPRKCRATVVGLPIYRLMIFL